MVIVPAMTNMLQKLFNCSSHIMGKRTCSHLAAECYVHNFFIGVEGSGVPESPATLKALTFPSGATNDVFFRYEYRPIPPLSRHHIEPVPECNHVKEVPTTESCDNLSSIITIKNAAPSRPEDNI